MNIHIFDDQNSLSLSHDRVREAVLTVLRTEKISCEEVEVHLVDQEKICFLHEEYFQDPSPTDCISFPIDHPSEKNCHCLGTVFVCTDVAISYAREHGLDAEGEALLYVIHATLHLSGYDDLTKEEQRTMRKKEKSCMDLLKVEIPK